MKQHRGADAHRRPVHRHHDRFARAKQRLHEARGEAFALIRRVGGEVSDVVAGAEGILAAVQEHDTHRLVAVGLDKRLGQCDVHRCGHGVLARGPAEAQANDATLDRSGDPVAAVHHQASSHGRSSVSCVQALRGCMWICQ